jgi:hypothetical protein
MRALKSGYKGKGFGRVSAHIGRNFMQTHTLNVLGMHRKRRKLRCDASIIKGNLFEVGETLSSLTGIPLEVFH